MISIVSKKPVVFDNVNITDAFYCLLEEHKRLVFLPSRMIRSISFFQLALGVGN